MANLTITEANVALAATKGAKVEIIQAGATISPGETYYKDTGDSNKGKLAQANDSNAKKAAGIALTGASVDGYFVGLTSGPFTPGGTLVKGTEYYLSATAGKIAPQADLTTGDTIVSLFRATSTTEAVLAIDITDILL